MPPKKQDYITRAEFYKRISDTDKVIEDFRKLQVTRAADKIIDDACHQEIKMHLKALDISINSVHSILNNVSANGTRGLENSLKDIYSKISELTEITKSARVDNKFGKAWIEWKNAKPWRKILFSTKSYVGIIMMGFALHKITIGTQSILNIIIEFFIK